MIKTIKVNSPTYDADTRVAAVRLDLSDGGFSILTIDLDNLIPFMNLSSQDAVDFFVVTCAVYGIDRFIKRRRNSVDGWSREFKIKFPVDDLHKWNPLVPKFNELLSFLTGDYWETEFYRVTFNFPSEGVASIFAGEFSHVNLFSGGLDSFIGALDALNQDGNRILFVSHYDPQMRGPKTDQDKLINKIIPMYGSKFEHIPSVNISLKSSTLGQRETTLRSRSLLFCGIALLIANGKQIAEITVPENGSVSLNYPLSSSRRSACSTRTTHPTVIDLIQEIWQVLGFSVNIRNPYEFVTKGEMVRNCLDQTSLVNFVSESNSCGKRGHRSHWDEGKRYSTHCGVCMPCIYRRASLVSVNDTTTYGNDVNLLVPFLTKKSQDLGACLDFLKKSLPVTEIKNELMVNGMRDLSKVDRFASLIVRTRTELSYLIDQIGNAQVKEKAGL